MTTLVSGTSAWTNRFTSPTVEDLIADIDIEHRELFDHARTCLGKLDGIVERLSWQGIPWRWTLVYAAESDPDTLLTYLVPEPGRPQISVPLRTEIINQIKPRKISRIVRDGILQASHVDQVYWPSWDLASKTGIGEIIQLVKLRVAAAS